MFKYRIILRFGYYDRWFEFDNINVATQFAKDVLKYGVPNEDCPDREFSIRMDIINIEAEIEEEAQEEE